MEVVQEAMRRRSEDDAGHADEQDPRVQGVRPREELSPRRLWLFNRTLAAKEHRRIEEGVGPAEVLEVAVTRHAGEERQAERRQAEQDVLHLPAEELCTREKRCVTRLVDHGTMIATPVYP